MKAAALNMVSTPRLQDNLDSAASLLAQAAEQEVELAVLPEYFCLMGQQDSDKLAIQEAFGDGRIQNFLAENARQHRMWLIGGTLPLTTSDPQRVSNTTLVYDPTGACVARYDKVHLFRFDNGQERYDESQRLQAGQQPVAFELTSRTGERWRVGLSICYDLRFPELYRALAADILVVPSAFTYTTGQAHWEVLLRARAIENLAYVLASAQGGSHENGRQTWGHSLAVDPWGRVMDVHPAGPGMAVAELDLALIRRVRMQLPALSHRVFVP